MRCPKCGKDNPVSATSCHNCRLPFRRICPRCKTANSLRQAHCGNCGLKLINQCPKCKTKNHPLQKYCGNCGLNIIRICQRCGMNNPASQKHCLNCSSLLTSPKTLRITKDDEQNVKQDPLISKQIGKIPPQRDIVNSIIEKNKQVKKHPNLLFYPNPISPSNSYKVDFSLKEIKADIKQQDQPESFVIDQTDTHILDKETISDKAQFVTKEIKDQSSQIIKKEIIEEEQIEEEQIEKEQIIEEQIIEEQIEEEQIEEEQIEEEQIEEEQIEEEEIEEEQIEEEQIEEEQIIEEEIEEEQIEEEEIEEEQIIEEEIEEEQIEEEEIEEEEIEEEEIEEEEIEYSIDDDLKRDEEFSMLPSNIANKKPKKDIRAKLVRFALFSLEIVNMSTLLKSLDKSLLDEVRNNLLTGLKEIGNKKAIVIPVSESIIVLEFPYTVDSKSSSIQALGVANKAFDLVGSLNSFLLQSSGQYLKIKIGIAFNDSEGMTQLERSIANQGSIIVNQEVRDDTFDLINYELIGPIPIGNRMIKFYKYNIPNRDVSEELKEKIKKAKYDTNSGETAEMLSPELEAKPEQSPIPTPELEAIQVPLLTPEPIPGYTEEKTENEDNYPPSVEPSPPQNKYSISIKELHFQEILQNIQQAIMTMQESSKGDFIGIISDRGYGKSKIFNELRGMLNPQEFIWISSSCNFQHQKIPLSGLKDLLGSLIGLPYVIYNTEEAKAHINNTLKDIIPESQQQIYDILYYLLLGEEKQGINKFIITQTFLQLFGIIKEKFFIILVLEDFDLIDLATLEILEKLMLSGLHTKNLLFLASTPSDFNFLLDSPVLANNIKCLQSLPITKETINQFLQKLAGNPLQIPESIIDKILSVSNGNPLVIENIISLMYEFGVIVQTNEGSEYNTEAQQWDVPSTFQDVIQFRLNRLHQESSEAFNLLALSSFIGPKFFPKISKELHQSQQGFDESLKTLFNLGYFIIEHNSSIAFTSVNIWEIIYYNSVSEENRQQYHSHIYVYIKGLLNNGGYVDPAYLAIHAENSGDIIDAINYLNSTANNLAVLGLSKAYNSVMNHYLNLIDQYEIENKNEIKHQAYESLVIMNYINNPELAIHYLSTLMPIYQNTQNINKFLEFNDYYAFALEKQNRFQDAFNLIQNSIDFLANQNLEFEKVLMSSLQVNLMRKMGKHGWVINTCKKELIPSLVNAIEKNQSIPGLPVEHLVRLLCTVKLNYASALIATTRIEAFDVLTEVGAESEKYKWNDIKLKAFVLKGKAHAIRGEISNALDIINQSQEILKQIPGITEYSMISLETACYTSIELANWGMLDKASTELEIQASTVNDIRFLVLARIYKALLTRIARKIDLSRNILNNTMSLAKEYNLIDYEITINYYLSADLVQSNKLDEAKELILNSIELSKADDMQNYNTLISLYRLLGDLYLKKSNIEEAKENYESSLSLATQIKHNSQIAKSLVSISLLSQDFITKENDDKRKNEHAQTANKMLYAVLDIYKNLGNNFHIERTKGHIEKLEATAKIYSIELLPINTQNS